jgi:hypothetical protein
MYIAEGGLGRQTDSRRRQSKHQLHSYLMNEEYTIRLASETAFGEVFQVKIEMDHKSGSGEPQIDSQIFLRC